MEHADPPAQTSPQHTQRVRCLVVDDVPSERRELVQILEREADLEVIGEAGDGDEAVLLTKAFGPDVISMDVQMPGMDGFAASRSIMTEVPTPIVIVSGTRDTEETRFAMQALDAGALTVVQKPCKAADTQRAARTYSSTIRAMSEVSVTRRIDPAQTRGGPADNRRRSGGFARPESLRANLVAIAASTGGPRALHQLLTPLPRDFPAAILVVQHISSGFTDGLARWLDADSDLDVEIARDGARLRPGTVYIAASDRHLGLANRETIATSDDPPIAGHRPSATFLFSSVAEHADHDALGLILTGMGSDGVDGLAAFHRVGGTVIAQDETSSVVFGMPAAAAAAGVADVVLPLDAIGDRLLSLSRVGERS